MITAFTPVKNEENFIPLYVENLKDKVQEIFLLDTGSTDNTLDIVSDLQKQYPGLITLEQYHTNSLSYVWEEGKVRNYGLSKTKYDWVIGIDADEMLSDNFTTLIKPPKAHHDITYSFAFIPFWKNLSTVRVSTKNDKRWYGNQIVRLFNKRFSQYKDIGNHAPLVYDINHVQYIPKVHLYHLHYALFSRCKVNDNRFGDLNKAQYRDTDILPTVTDEDFDWLLHNPQEYTLDIIDWERPLPKALQAHL